MSKTIWWSVLIVVVIALGAVLYYQGQKAPPRFTPPVVEPKPPAPPAEPQIRYPVESAPEKPLPSLNQSDTAVKEALQGLWGEKTLEQFFNLNEFIRRVVATVDNLPRPKVALRLMPVKQAPGQFRVTGKGETLAMSPDNIKRYAPYVQFAEAVDSAKLVALYVRFYPLFQQAYQDLGYPKGYFNDRLVEVIDHLLAAPEVPAGTRLAQPKVFYQYADPDLEARSAGQKILMRIGGDNAARIKAKLREIRNELTRQGPRS